MQSRRRKKFQSSLIITPTENTSHKILDFRDVNGNKHTTTATTSYKTIETTQNPAKHKHNNNKFLFSKVQNTIFILSSFAIATEFLTPIFPTTTAFQLSTALAKKSSSNTKKSEVQQLLRKNARKQCYDRANQRWLGSSKKFEVSKLNNIN